ncbi:MAG: TetR/AcrR family transcriptional regulator [bacterium]|nr:TetR/AcrR family transcriptional regulator [bacterium]
MTNIKEQHIEEDANSTRNEILKAAEDFFGNFGYLGTAVSQIAKAVNITKASLYYHFESKQDLFEEVLMKSFGQLKVMIDEIIDTPLKAGEKLEKITFAYLEHGSKQGSLIQSALSRFSKDEELVLVKTIKRLRQEIMKLVEPLIKVVLKQNNKSRQLDAEIVTQLYFNMMDSFLIRNSFKKEKYEQQAVAKQINLLLFK